MSITRNYRIILLLIAVVTVSNIIVSAQQKIWSENFQNKSSITTDKAVARQSFPKEYKLFDLDIDPLRRQLFSIAGDTARQSSTIISLPNSEGKIERFEVFEASNFEPDLQARFPEIRAFSGRGITDQYATLKLSISPDGIQTMVFRTDAENEFIEPYSEDRATYAVFKSSREKGELPWTCTTQEKNFFTIWKATLPKTNAPLSSAGQLKTMRLAQSCNGEYANFFGATSAAQEGLVLAAYNNTLTRANGVYEKDLALHLNLISRTTEVIFYNPATDPYSNSLSNWNTELQETLTETIGNDNYDIGHMFGASGGGGNAGCIGCVCDNPDLVNEQAKGSGITSPADSIPRGDNFDIDYVVHEVGHQLGGNHTFSHSTEGMGVNKEVGSGITIMGYAGITDQDVAPHSIDIYHEATIAQIQTNLATKGCPVSTNMTANRPPVVAPVSNYTIPRDTPFALTGSATDPENDPLSYNWEQNDDAATYIDVLSIASATKPVGPNWLSFPSTASPTRLFPRLSTILTGGRTTRGTGNDANIDIEALSTVARVLNFRLTVRDNHPYVPGSTIGQTQFTDLAVTVSTAAGPFEVTAQNAAPTTTWQAGTMQTVTWNEANTRLSPVSTANVKISLSTDGGQTFPYVLAATTPNDGTQAVTIPLVATTTARLKVEAIGNIFFDINNVNFSVLSPTAAPASVTGHVVNADGRGISRAVVTMRDANGDELRTATTNAFGYFNFSELPTGNLYTLTVRRKGFVFFNNSQAFTLNGDLNDVIFTGNPQ